MSPPYLRRKPRGQRTHYRSDEAAGHEGSARNARMRKLRELIDGIAIATLVTLDADGSLHGRPMAMQAMDDDGVLWFLTADHSAKTHDVLLHPEVCVSFAVPEAQRYVSVSGRAEVVREPERIQHFWRPEMQAWFPLGLDDPDLALLRVDIEQAQYWDAHASRLVQLFERARAAVAGEPPPAGNGSAHKLTLKHRIGPDNIS